MDPKGCLLRCTLEGQTLLILQCWRYQVSFGEGVQFFENMVCCNCAFAQVFGVVLFVPGCRVLPAVAEPKAALLTVNSHFLNCTNFGGHEMTIGVRSDPWNADVLCFLDRNVEWLSNPVPGQAEQLVDFFFMKPTLGQHPSK